MYLYATRCRLFHRYNRPRMRQQSIVLVAAAFVVVSCSRPSKTAADLVVVNGNVWTGDQSQADARAVAIAGDRIVAVGSAGDIDAWRGPGTRVVDAGRRRVVPGFNDAHVHFVDGGRQLDNVDLKDADSPEEFARRIGERAKTAGPGEWILGGDWDDQRWTPPRLPTRQLVDPLTPTTPVFVSRYDGHMALANTAALTLAGVTAKTNDPPGGTIVRDAAGNPTGVLKDAAMNFVARVIPPMTREQRTHAVKRALEHAASIGVTSVQDMNPSYDDISIYADLLNRGELTTRIYAAPLETTWQDQARLGIHRAFGSAWLNPFYREGARAYSEFP